jgi:transcriptional regulator with XRE-family HTH domain
LALIFTTMHFLGKNLRYLRRQSAKTQSEIASLIQKGQTTIGNWENGISEPSLNELLIISNYFDITIDALLKTDLSGKTDLSATQAPDTQHQPVVVRPYDQVGRPYDQVGRPYDQPEKELPTAGEQDNLSFVWQAIRNLRAEMEQLQALLPKRKGGETKSGQSS